MRAKTHGDEVYQHVRADILACRLPPGAKLKISELCDRLEVSNGAVREALSRLSADGLVVAEPQRGFSVAPVSPTDLTDLTEARVEIEGLCLREAMRDGTVEWESRLVAAFHRLSHIGEREPSDRARLNEAWAAAHGEFHEALVAACGNTWLLRVRAMLYERSERYRRLSVPVRREDRDVNAEHKAIMEAALARDATGASERMGEHLMTTARILLSAPVLSGASDRARRPSAAA